MAGAMHFRHPCSIVRGLVSLSQQWQHQRRLLYSNNVLDARQHLGTLREIVVPSQRHPGWAIHEPVNVVFVVLI